LVLSTYAAALDAVAVPPARLIAPP
jgi:hypothetical protein